MPKQVTKDQHVNESAKASQDPSTKGTPLSTPEFGSVQCRSPGLSSATTTPRQHNRKQVVLEKRSSSKVKEDHVPPSQPRVNASHRPLPKPKPPSQCPLLCCFYAEFDNKVGPKICYQSPEHFMEQDIRLSSTKLENMLFQAFKGKNDDENQTKGEDVASSQEETLGEDPSQFFIFNSCSEYIITGSELTGNIINLSTHHIHILTRPTMLSDSKYERNSLHFCVGFVLRRSEDPRPFRPALSKLAVTLRDMEGASQFLSKTTADGDRPHIRSLLTNILVSLNSERCECSLLLGKADLLNLKLFRPPKMPAIPVNDHAVPILLRRDWQVQAYDWDLSINWVSLYIDGMATGLQISKRAEVDMEMVRACLRVLSHHGVIALVDMFFYTNRYECTENISSLISGTGKSKLLQEAVDFAFKRHPNEMTNPSPMYTRCGADSSPELHSSSPTARSMLSTSSIHVEASKEGHMVGLGQRISCSPSKDHLSTMMRQEDYNEICVAVAEFYCGLNRTMSIGDRWLSLVEKRLTPGVASEVDWKNMFRVLDHRRLTTFGQVHGLIKRVHNFPLLIDDSTSLPFKSTFIQQELKYSLANHDRLRAGGQAKNHAIAEKRRMATSLAASMMDGKHCDDALVCACELSLIEIYDLFEGEKIVSCYI